jgi:hypothetical protein
MLLWWGKVAVPAKSPDLGNNCPVSGILIYLASSQTTFYHQRRELIMDWSATNGLRTNRMCFTDTDWHYGRYGLWTEHSLWICNAVVSFVCLEHCVERCICPYPWLSPTLWACTLAYPTVLTIVHRDGTSILSLHTIDNKNPVCLILLL